MALTRLKLYNVRCLEEVEITPSPGLNLIIGANASGKTSLLEAISLLGTGRSFRTSQIGQVIRHGAENLRVLGHQQEGQGPEDKLGIERGRKGRRVSINGELQDSIANLVQKLPLQVFSPDTHYGFLHIARQRRGILDWGVFHVEPRFYPLWIRHQRLLAQRNAALRAQHKAAVCFVWDTELVSVAEQLHAFRHGYLESWNTHFQRYCELLLGSPHGEIVLRPGWDLTLGLSKALEQDRDKDRLRGFTHAGAHRVDIQLRFQDYLAREKASHGQQKLLVMAMRLAQTELFINKTERSCVLLIDDLAAELDPDRRRRLMSALTALPVQVFVTATEAGLIDTRSWSACRQFHVEQGLLREEK